MQTGLHSVVSNSTQSIKFILISFGLFQEKEYYVAEEIENDGITPSTNREIHDLENEMNEVEQKIARDSSVELNTIMSGLGLRQPHGNQTKSIINAVRCFVRYRNVQVHQQVIEGLEQKLVAMRQCKHELERYGNFMHLQIEQNPLTHSTLNEGKNIVNTAQKFVENTNIKSIILLKEAFIEGKTLSISYVNEQISVRLG